MAVYLKKLLLGSEVAVYIEHIHTMSSSPCDPELACGALVVFLKFDLVVPLASTFLTLVLGSDSLLMYYY